MALYIKNQKIDFFQTITKGKLTEETAKKYFEEYVEKLHASNSDAGEFVVAFEVSETFTDDAFCVELKADKLSFTGGKRGVIYGVFTFLEKVGFRFFTPDLEVCPTEDVFLQEFTLEECSPFEFRDILSIGATEKRWSLKQKLNSDLWSARGLLEEDGGGYDFAGIPAHSLTGEFLMKPFIESNPEYFALKNGVRITDRMGQICMTNDEAIEAVTQEVFKLIEENPGKNIVSVSQGDNHNFCECDSCKAAVEANGLMHTYFDVVCKIARAVKEKYPHILLHTLAYEATCRDINFLLEDNIMVQYCYGKCHTHAITDENCSYNRETEKQIKNMAKMCKNLHIWNYTNCFKYELLEYPFVKNFYPNMRFYAECGVKGILNEGMHRDKEVVDFATAYELRSYVLAKLMWNPYMSEEEFKGHMTEFCEAFYGPGYAWILKYLDLYPKYAGECATYDAILSDKNGMCHNDARSVHIIQEEKTEEFLKLANDYLNRALVGASKEQIARIDKLKTCVLYYELLWGMRGILNDGTQKEKEIVLEKNQELISRISNQKLVITFWGQTRESQNIELANMKDVPPSEWNYRW